jgi:hypothetical protein
MKSNRTDRVLPPALWKVEYGKRAATYQGFHLEKNGNCNLRSVPCDFTRWQVIAYMTNCYDLSNGKPGALKETMVTK